MYVPESFAETDRARLWAFLRKHDFATLITAVGTTPFATHLPILLDERGEQGTLLGHMARANPQWRAFDGTSEALVIFQGPHAYVSPTWYATHPSVPTWNYTAVHAYGTPRLLDDEAAVRDVLRRTTSLYEADGQWSLDGLPDAYMRGMMCGIVAFEIPIARLEGKFKLSQNRDAEDRGRVADALDDRADGFDRDLAVLMRER